MVVAGVLGSSYVAYTSGPPYEGPPAQPHPEPPDPWYALLKAEPGPARAWEAELAVGTYTSANMRNGNLLTAIPTVNWSGSGPDVAMLLYQNSANVDSTLDLTCGMGFDLGPGWSTSYSAQWILDPPDDPTKVLAHVCQFRS